MMTDPLNPETPRSDAAALPACLRQEPRDVGTLTLEWYKDRKEVLKRIAQIKAAGFDTNMRCFFDEVDDQGTIKMELFFPCFLLPPVEIVGQPS